MIMSYFIKHNNIIQYTGWQKLISNQSLIYPILFEAISSLRKLCQHSYRRSFPIVLLFIGHVLLLVFKCLWFYVSQFIYYHHKKPDILDLYIEEKSPLSLSYTHTHTINTTFQLLLSHGEAINIIEWLAK